MGGGFGTVHSAIRNSDGAEVAVKEISKDSVVAMEDNIPLEIVLLQQVADVPGVVRSLSARRISLLGAMPRYSVSLPRNLRNIQAHCPVEPTPCGGFYECPNGTVCREYW